MKHRFEQSNGASPFRNLILSSLLLAFLLLIMVVSVSGIADSTADRAQRSLQTALERDIARCYAATGSYPRDLETLKTGYGLTYDEDRFFIDYHLEGANLAPDYTIIDKEAEE